MESKEKPGTFMASKKVCDMSGIERESRVSFDVQNHNGKQK